MRLIGRYVINPDDTAKMPASAWSTTPAISVAITVRTIKFQRLVGGAVALKLGTGLNTSAAALTMASAVTAIVVNVRNSFILR